MFSGNNQDERQVQLPLSNIFVTAVLGSGTPVATGLGSLGAPFWADDSWVGLLTSLLPWALGKDGYRPCYRNSVQVQFPKSIGGGEIQQMIGSKKFSCIALDPYSQ